MDFWDVNFKLSTKAWGQLLYWLLSRLAGKELKTQKEKDSEVLEGTGEIKQKPPCESKNIRPKRR